MIARIYNNNPVPVSINFINNEGYNAGFMWLIDPWTIELPYEIPAFDSLDLRVKIGLPVDNTFGLLTDTLFVGTEIDTHNVIICVDEDLLSSKEDYFSDMQTRLSPNPARNHAEIQLLNVEAGDLKIQVYDVQGTLSSEKYIRVNQDGNMRFSLDEQISGLKSGIYYIRTINGKNESVVKFIRLD